MPLIQKSAPLTDPDEFADVAEVLGRVLRSHRRAAGLSQEDVAFAAGVAVYTYSTLERGLSTAGGPANPTLRTLLRVFRALGVEPREVAASFAPFRTSATTTDAPPDERRAEHPVREVRLARPR